MNIYSKMITLGIALILFAFSVITFLDGINLQDELYSVVFFIFLTIAVAIFMITGLRHADFQQKNPYIENFYTEEEIDRFHKNFPS